MKTTWPACLECGIVTKDLNPETHRCPVPTRCVVVTLQRAAVLGEAAAQLSRRLFGNAAQEEFELARVAVA